MSEVRKKLKEEDKKPVPYKLKPIEITVEELIAAKRRGLPVRKASPFGLTAEQYGKIYTIGAYRMRVSDIDNIPVEELERRLKEVKTAEKGTDEEIKRKQEEIKRKKEATREEQKRMIYREVGTLKAMADDEGKAANRYRDAAKDSPLPTMSKVLFSIASDEQAHEQRLRMLAVELERGIL
jgi:rubrerythrin